MLVTITASKVIPTTVKGNINTFMVAVCGVISPKPIVNVVTTTK